MRVVSWNIEHGRNIEQAAQDIAAIDDLTDADLLLVQEVSGDAAALLAELLGMQVGYAEGPLHRATGIPFGNAVLSPWPITQVGSVPMPFTAALGGHTRIATVATVEIDGQPLAAYSIHVETVLLSLARRAAQVSAVAAHALARPEAEIIVGGDFNTASGRSVSTFDRVMGDYGLDRLSVERQPTFERFGRGFPLDHLYGRGLDVVATGTVAETGASDHQPLWVTLRRRS